MRGTGIPLTPLPWERVLAVARGRVLGEWLEGAESQLLLPEAGLWIQDLNQSAAVQPERRALRVLAGWLPQDDILRTFPCPRLLEHRRTGRNS